LATFPFPPLHCSLPRRPSSRARAPAVSASHPAAFPNRNGSIQSPNPKKRRVDFIQCGWCPSIDRSIPFLPAAARRPTDSVSEPNPLPPLSQIEQAAADGERVSRSTVPDSTPSKASPAAPIPRFDAESGVFRGSRDALAPGLPRRSSRGRATHVVGAVQQLQPPPGVHPVVGAEVPRAEARALHRGGPR